MSKKRGHSGPPRRPYRPRSPRRRILAYTEGEATEVGYLEHWGKKHRDATIVNVDPRHGVPGTLVASAVAAAKRNRSRAEEIDRYDSIWCVFDVDQHPNLLGALGQARDGKVNVALSNPCIELWFVLHFEDRAAHIERDRVQHRSAKLLGCDKRLTETALTKLDQGYDQAKARAVYLEQKHQGDGSPPHSNPGSSIWRLLDSVADKSM